MEQVHTLLVNDEELADVYNAFINFFTTITEKLNIQQIEKGDAAQFYKIHFLETPPA